jgi:hypothetical protein
VLWLGIFHLYYAGKYAPPSDCTIVFSQSKFIDKLIKKTIYRSRKDLEKSFLSSGRTVSKGF